MLLSILKLSGDNHPDMGLCLPSIFFGIKASIVFLSVENAIIPRSFLFPPHQSETEAAHTDLSEMVQPFLTFIVSKYIYNLQQNDQRDSRSATAPRFHSRPIIVLPIQMLSVFMLSTPLWYLEARFNQSTA